MDKAIEAAARAAYEMSAAELDESPSWSQISRETRAVYRQMGRAVKVAVNHRIAAEKAVLANGVNCSSCGVRLPKDYEKPCPDCGALDIDTTALADAIGADHGQ